jgi:hypothetical protein
MMLFPLLTASLHCTLDVAEKKLCQKRRGLALGAAGSYSICSTDTALLAPAAKTGFVTVAWVVRIVTGTAQASLKMGSVRVDVSIGRTNATLSVRTEGRKTLRETLNWIPTRGGDGSGSILVTMSLNESGVLMSLGGEPGQTRAFFQGTAWQDVSLSRTRFSKTRLCIRKSSGTRVHNLRAFDRALLVEEWEHVFKLSVMNFNQGADWWRKERTQKENAKKDETNGIRGNMKNRVYVIDDDDDDGDYDGDNDDDDDDDDFDNGDTPKTGEALSDSSTTSAPASAAPLTTKLATNCAQWKLNGYCKSNRKYMQLKCEGSCE